MKLTKERLQQIINEEIMIESEPERHARELESSEEVEHTVAAIKSLNELVENLAKNIQKELEDLEARIQRLEVQAHEHSF